MADSVVHSVVSNLLGRTIDLLTDEVKFLHGVANQVHTLRDELQWIHAFLEDADAVRQKEGDKRLQDLLSKFRDIAYDAEDAIDTFILKVASVRNRGGFWGVVKRSAGIFNETKHRHRAGVQIEAINSRISKIKERYPDCVVQNIAGTSTNNRRPRLGCRRSYAHEEKDVVVVGLDEDIKKLVAELTNKEGRARVVSIAGIGGSGKTTLARKLYNHVDIQNHFDCHVWVSISQEWHARDLLINIITQTTSPSNENRKSIQEMSRKSNQEMSDEEMRRKSIQKMSDEELVIKVHNFLKEKLYLVVLDDVWENKAWDELRPAFPNENVGSKLIITSRTQNVALHADPNCFVHKPRNLTDDEAWELLRQKVKHVIGVDRREDTRRFHELGQEIVKKCSGLPLAIVVLGGLLAKTTSLEEWKNIGQNISLELRKVGKEGTQKYGEVLRVLGLSYDSLPYCLKPCFLYLGIFPKNSEIKVKPLIRMWIAEGFISFSQIDREETLEQAGEEYLQQLIQRNLIQVVEKDTTGRPKSCLMHDLLRDLCLEKAREECFFEILSSFKSTTTNAIQGSVSKARRIVVHFGDDADSIKCSLLGLKNSCIRSLLCFGSRFKLSKSEWRSLCTNVPLLRVLHVQGHSFEESSFRLCLTAGCMLLHLPCVYFRARRDGALAEVSRLLDSFSFCRLPKRIGNLYHLRYLGLAEEYRLEIPQSFGNLRSLQTLDIRDARYHVGAEVVRKMEQLRYLGLESLRINGRDFGSKNLQCLKVVKAGDWMTRTLPYLTNLQKLGIYRIKTVEQVKKVLESPCIRSDRLRSLHLNLFPSPEEFPSLEQLSRCRNLSKLCLVGEITEEVQLQQQLPPHLTKLTLACSELREQDPMVALEKLPFLKFLRLGRSSYCGRQMTCSASGFPQLQHLEIDNQPILEEWIVEEGAMPHLKHLMIYDCRELRMIPEGLKFITTLQELKILYMPEEFENRVRKVDSGDAEATSDPHQGDDYYKIRHIPTVKIGFALGDPLI